jgi:hypothetical protein
VPGRRQVLSDSLIQQVWVVQDKTILAEDITEGTAEEAEQGGAEALCGTVVRRGTARAASLEMGFGERAAGRWGRG